MIERAVITALGTLTKPWLKYDSEKGDYVDSTVHPTVIERDGKVIVSGEDGLYWIDAYGEYEGGGDMWISPILEKFAEENGLHWEWEDAGCISLWS